MILCCAEISQYLISTTLLCKMLLMNFEDASEKFYTFVYYRKSFKVSSKGLGVDST